MGRLKTLSLILLGLLPMGASAQCLGHVQMGANRIDVEIVADKASRAKGLMYREDLAQNAGMLFVYPQENDLTFWMKNTPRSLDILFYDQNGQLQKFYEATEPLSETKLPGRAALVLEVNAGVFGQNRGDFKNLRFALEDAAQCPEFVAWHILRLD